MVNLPRVSIDTDMSDEMCFGCGDNNPIGLKLKLKSQSLHIEFMFARSMFNASDMDEQNKLLNRVADLVDRGYIQTTSGKNLGTINAENLKAAHEELESGKAIGKIVLEGF